MQIDPVPTPGESCESGGLGQIFMCELREASKPEDLRRTFAEARERTEARARANDTWGRRDRCPDYSC